MASFGRRIERAGLQADRDLPVRVRGHLGGVVRAAPAADRDLRRRAGVGLRARRACSRSCCLLLPTGTVRDIFFHLAFAAYVGAFFNLNPFIERDGYHILVDVLREPGLRRRAKEQFAAQAARRAARATDSPVLAALLDLRASAGRCWPRCFAIGMSLRYETVVPGRRRTADCVVYGVHGHAVGGVLPPGDRRARQAAAGRAVRGVRLTMADVGSRRRRQADRAPARRPGVPRARSGATRRPRAARRGWTSLAEEMSLGARQGDDTLDMRESKSSLAGVMMAAAMEGVGIYQFAENVLPHLEDDPGRGRRRALRVDLPAIPLPERRRAAAARRCAPRRPRRRAQRRGRRRGRRRRAPRAVAVAAAAVRPQPRRPRRPRRRPRRRRREQAADAAGGGEGRRGRGGATRAGRPRRRPPRRSPPPSRRAAEDRAAGRRRRRPRSPRTRRTSRARAICRAAASRPAQVAGGRPGRRQGARRRARRGRRRAARAPPWPARRSTGRPAGPAARAPVEPAPAVRPEQMAPAPPVEVTGTGGDGGSAAAEALLQEQEPRARRRRGEEPPRRHRRPARWSGCSASSPRSTRSSCRPQTGTSSSGSGAGWTSRGSTARRSTRAARPRASSRREIADLKGDVRPERGRLAVPDRRDRASSATAATKTTSTSRSTARRRPADQAAAPRRAHRRSPAAPVAPAPPSSRPRPPRRPVTPAPVAAPVAAAAAAPPEPKAGHSASFLAVKAETSKAGGKGGTAQLHGGQAGPAPAGAGGRGRAGARAGCGRRWPTFSGVSDAYPGDNAPQRADRRVDGGRGREARPAAASCRSWPRSSSRG